MKGNSLKCLLGLLVVGLSTAGATTAAEEKAVDAVAPVEVSETKLTAGTSFDDRITKFFEQIKQLRALKKFSYTMISEVIDMPLELEAEHMYSASGDLKTDVWDRAEVSHGRNEKDITLINLYPAKDLMITAADIEKALGKGMSSPPIKTDEYLSKEFGYKEEMKILYRKGKLNINFEVITSPKERVHKLAFYRD
jgi:hypothetical protein